MATGKLAHDTPRAARYEAAELTECVVKRMKAGDAPVYFLAFGVLRFLPVGTGLSIPRFAFLQGDKSVNLGDRHRAFVARSLLSVAEAESLAKSVGSYVSVASPKPATVSIPGVWDRGVFVGWDESTGARRCLPAIPHSLRIDELHYPNDAIAQELGEKGIRKLDGLVGTTLGLDFQQHRDRLGNLLVVYPDAKIQVAVRGVKGGFGLGVELLSREYKLSKLILQIRVYRDDRLTDAIVVAKPARRKVYTFDADFDAVAVEVFSSDGRILYRLKAPLLLKISSVLSVVGTSGHYSFDVAGPGAGASSRVDVKSSHGTHMEARAGDWHDPPWRARSRAARSLRLPQSLQVYSGIPGEDSQAVAYLQRLIRQASSGIVRVWDQYFGPSDAVKLVPALFNLTLEVRILTAARPTPEEDAGARVAATSARAWKEDSLGTALERLRAPRPEGIGCQNVRCRVDSSGKSHDRFLMIGERVWQLGCSLNHIGSVVSTIMEVGAAPKLLGLFDQFWDEAGEDSEL